jgi:transposase
MTQKDLFSRALMIEKPWYIDEIQFDCEQGQLDIWIDFERGSEFYYKDSETGVEGYYKAYDTTQKTWRHLNFFQYRCILHAWVPRVRTDKGDVRLVKAPWEGVSSGFTLLFEALILELVKQMPVHQISKLIGSYDKKIWDMLQLYTWECRDREDFSEVTSIGVDETAVRRGHDYVTLFVDLEQKKTLFVTPGRDNEVVQEFAEDLKEHNGNPENIAQISCDMSPAFIRGVEENLPNAAIVFDRFHVVKILNQAIAAVRKKELKENPILMNSRYIFLKNKENLTLSQKLKLEQIRISGINLKTMKALHMREAFQQIYHAPTPNLFQQWLKKWYICATHSRIQPIIEAAKTIKRHWQGIINWAHYQISNGILEGFNSIFQAAKAKARGYRTTEVIAIIIYILTGKLDFAKVNPFYSTHE